ncbi:MAG TPA: hypothetical protein VF178_16190 [Gemmatimonadaceae bacterium]
MRAIRAVGRAGVMAVLSLTAPYLVAQDPNPCAVITAAEIGSALGSTPGTATAEGPRVERDPDLRRWHCDRQVGENVLTVTVYEFTTAASAASAMTTTLNEIKADKDMIQVTETPGIGDRAAGGATGEGAMWIAVTGKYMLVLTLAGDIANPERTHEPMRRLLSAGVARLR